MATLLGHVEGTHEIYNDIDHVISFAAQAWFARSGYNGTRDPVVQEKRVLVKIGAHRHLVPGPNLQGSNGTPLSSPCTSQRNLDERRSGTPRSNRGACSRIGSAGSAQGFQLGPPGSRGLIRPEKITGNLQNNETLGNEREHKEIINDIYVAEYIIAEVPTLMDLLRSSTCKNEIGPVPRNAKLFEAVLALAKLRWLIRLHYALVALGGDRCSLQRMLIGTLSDVCENHQYPHSPLEVFELVVATLQTRFQQSWALVLAYVGAYEPGQHKSNMRASESRHGPRPFTAPNTHENGFPLPYQPSYHRKAFLGKTEEGVKFDDNAAFLWQVVDDTFAAWLVQQDPLIYPATKVWEELDYWGVPRPAVRTNLDGLITWQSHKDSAGSQKMHSRPAQRQAHHLVLTVELPELRFRNMATDEEILEMARDIVAHPKTFNAGIRSRVAKVLQGREELEGWLEVDTAIDLDEDQLSVYLLHSADPRDCGRLHKGQLEVLRDTTKPWLAGRESRFNASAASWPFPTPRPEYLKDFAFKPSIMESQYESFQYSEREIVSREKYNHAPNSVWR